MPEFVQRRPTCEAHLITSETADAVAEWCGGVVLPNGSVMYPTDEVDLIARQGNYLVKRPGADFVQVPQVEFEAQWEPAE
jgi:hypothetical protein